MLVIIVNPIQTQSKPSQQLFFYKAAVLQNFLRLLRSVLRVLLIRHTSLHVLPTSLKLRTYILWETNVLVYIKPSPNHHRFHHCRHFTHLHTTSLHLNWNVPPHTWVLRNRMGCREMHFKKVEW